MFTYNLEWAILDEEKSAPDRYNNFLRSYKARFFLEFYFDIKARGYIRLNHPDHK